MSSQNVIEVTDDSFDKDVLKQSKLVLVDFWAPWCGPCRMLAPILEEIASEKSEIIIAKMDVDDNQMIPSKHGIRSIPTMMLFKGGELVATKTGALPKTTLEEWISNHL